MKELHTKDVDKPRCLFVKKEKQCVIGCLLRMTLEYVGPFTSVIQKRTKYAEAYMILTELIILEMVFSAVISLTHLLIETEIVFQYSIISELLILIV